MNIAALVAVLGTTIAAIVGAWLAIRRAPEERDGVFISTAEGATRILNSAMLALEKDLDRKATTIEELQEDAKAKSAALRRKDEIIERQRRQIADLERPAP